MPAGLSIAAVVFVIVIGILVVIQLVAITVLFVIIKNLIQEIRERIDPLITKTNALLITANETAQNVQGKVEHIAERSAETSDKVSGRIDAVSSFIQRVIVMPLIGGAAAADGVREGAAAWRSARRRRRACE